MKYASRSFICIICGRLGIGKLWCMVVLGGLSIFIMRVVCMHSHWGVIGV